jgi:RNA polymerase sigma factor (sigma-70 family)
MPELKKDTVPLEPEQPSTRNVEAMFREHNELLLRFLRARLQNDADAHEAAQESYVRLLQLDQSNQPSFMRAYLFRIATNVATDMLRRRRRTGTAVDVDEANDEGELVDPSKQEQTFAARQELTIAKEALDELPPRCRAAFVLTRLDGLSAREVGARLGVSDRMVRIYLVRALGHVHEALARGGAKWTR